MTTTYTSCAPTAGLTESDYWLGFFFILDLVSTVTLVLDLTWVLASVQEFAAANDPWLGHGYGDAGAKINDLLAGNGDSSSLRSGRRGMRLTVQSKDLSILLQEWWNRNTCG